MNFKIRHIGILISLMLIVSCDEESTNPVPDVYFNVTLEISSEPQFFYLRSQDNAMEISASDLGLSTLGYNNNGLIIYNAGSNNFYAFDRTCPHDVLSKTAVDLTDNNVATCPECESQFVLPSEGIPASGSESQYGLKKYKTQYDNSSGTLYVYN